MARIIRAENRNSGNRVSADDIAIGYNLRSIERHPAFAYRGKPLSDQQIRLVRNMRVKMRRR